MKNLLFKIISVLLLVVTTVSTRSQESGTSTESVFRTFQQQSNSEKRLDFFFGTHNRYRENSAYDWLDKVNIYLVEANKQKDSLDILNYLLMQSQVYHDLGDYDKSLAISKELYQTKEELNLKTKSIL
ncbi:MAG: histidine kinase, partial [Flavobacteriaceae bacterium]